jgi:hypothetical protein
MENVLEILKCKFELQFPRLFELTTGEFLIYDPIKEEIKSFKTVKPDLIHYHTYISIPINEKEVIIILSLHRSFYLINLDSQTTISLGPNKKTHHNEYVSGVLISPISVALLNTYGILHIWNFRENKLVNKFRIHEKRAPDYFRPKPELIYHSSSKTLFQFNHTEITAWDHLEKKKPIMKFEYNFSEIVFMSVFPSTNKFITRSPREIQIWSFDDKKVEEEFKLVPSSQKSDYICFAVILSGNRLAVGIDRGLDIENKLVVQIYNQERTSSNYSLIYQSQEFEYIEPFIKLEISNHLIISGLLENDGGFRTIRFDLDASRYPTWKQLDVALTNAVSTLVNPNHNKVMKVILLRNLDKSLPKDLINEVFTFF